MGKNSGKKQRQQKVKPVKASKQTDNIQPTSEQEGHTISEEGTNTIEPIVESTPKVVAPNILQVIQQIIVDALTSGEIKEDSISNTLRLINKTIIDALEVNGIKSIAKPQETPKPTPIPEVKPETTEIKPEIEEKKAGFEISETTIPLEQPIIQPTVEENPTGRLVSDKILIAGAGFPLQNDRGEYLTKFIWNVVFYSQIEKEDCEQYDLAVKAPFVTADHLIHQEIEDINLLAPLFKEFELLKNTVREFVDDYLVKNPQYKYYRVTPIF